MARTPAQNAAIYLRRNELARERGYASYYEQRKYRSKVREQVGEYDLHFGISRRDLQAVDQIALVEKSVEDTGSSGLSKTELYDTVRDALINTGIVEGELLDEKGYDIPWAIIRGFYSLRGARSMAA